MARIGSHILPIPACHLPTGEARLFLRPHEITVVAPGPDRIGGIVQDVRRVGAGRRIGLRLGARMAEIDVGLHEEVPVRGAEVGITISGGRLYI